MLKCPTDEEHWYFRQEMCLYRWSYAGNNGLWGTVGGSEARWITVTTTKKSKMF